MPQNIKAFLVVVALAAVVFAVSRRYACTLCSCSEFKRRTGAWVAMTAAAFLSHNFWLYSLLAVFIVLFAMQRDTSRPSMFLFLLFVFPAVKVAISGFGVINYLFYLDHPRLLSLVILLPAFLKSVQNPEPGRVKPRSVDLLVIAFISLAVLLELRDSSLTDALRNAFTNFIDIFLPYYVMSRSLRSVEDFRDLLLFFVTAATILAVIAVFEYARHWLLYISALNSMHVRWSLFGYMGRAGHVRSVASAGHSIVLGYILVIGIGFALFLRERSRTPAMLAGIAILTLAAGLYVSLSRGPWVGAVTLVVVFLIVGPRPLKELTKLGLIGALGLAILSLTPVSSKFIELLPFVGSTDAHTVEYRERLLDASLVVIMRNPWFGSVHYLDAPEMRQLASSWGFVDVVNTYVQIALNLGLVGLSLFGLFFFSVLMRIARAIRSLPLEEWELRVLGRVLLATTAAVLVIIGTVSMISLVPNLFWCLGGMGIAYWHLVNTRLQADLGLQQHETLPRP